MSGIDEETLFYELGYSFDEPGSYLFTSQLNRIMVWLLVTSLSLILLFGISQIFTIIGILLILINGNFQEYQFLKKKHLPVVILFLMIVSTLEQFNSGIKLPQNGNPFSGLNGMVVLLDLLWIALLIYSVILIEFIESVDGDVKYLVPSTEKAKYNFQTLEERLDSTRFQITTKVEQVSRRGLQDFYFRIIGSVGVLTFIIFFGTTAFWRFYTGIVDRFTLREEYNLAIYTLLSIFSVIFMFGIVVRSQQNKQ